MGILLRFVIGAGFSIAFACMLWGFCAALEALWKSKSRWIRAVPIMVGGLAVLAICAILVLYVYACGDLAVRAVERLR